MKFSVYRQLVVVVVCVALVGAAKLEDDDIITPCGVCTCNMRQASADCSDRQLYNIPTDLPANITNLSLSINRIQPAGDDEARLCQRYPNLKIVSLAWNGISTLSSLLHGCHLVEELDLTGNILEMVQPTELTDMSSLQALTALEVQELDASVFHRLKRLETLHLTFHGLTVQPGVFRELSSLRSLTLTLEKALRLQQHLFVFTEGNVLKQLTLKGSKVKEIPDDLLSELVNLKELHLDLPHLLQLKMNTNDRHQYLQVLEVSNVRSVAEDLLSGLHFLQVVILHGISHLAGAQLFQTATQVKELEIVQCSLTQLPSGWLDNMISLETLNLSDNRLEKLSPSDFIHSTSLKHLVLSNNKIQDLPPGVFSSLKPTLQQLLLDENQLRQLPAKTFTDMSMLEVLDLRKNMINDITTNSLRNLPRLHILQLSGNYISSLDHILWDSLPGLEELDLSENIISEFPETLLASNLSRLLFSANNLHNLPGQRLCRMGSLHRLALDDNPVFCDCYVRSLRRCLPRLLMSGTCSEPADVAGENIEELKECGPSTSVPALSTLVSQTPNQAAFHSFVAFLLEPTPAAETAIDTWSPQLGATIFTRDSGTPLASSAASRMMAATPTLMFPSSNSGLSTRSSQKLLILSSLVAELTVSSLPPEQTVSSSLSLEQTVSSSLPLEQTVFPVLPELTLQTSMPAQSAFLGTSYSTAQFSPKQDMLLETPLMLSDNPAMLATLLMPSHMAFTQVGTGESSQPHLPAPGGSSHSPLAADSPNHSHDPIKENLEDYDTYTGLEIVRPLVADGRLKEKEQPPVMPDTDLTTQLSQFPRASPGLDWLNFSAVRTQPESASNSDVAVTSESPPQQDNTTESLPPRIAHVKAQPETEETTGVLSVAGEITVAMFFSLVILLSILSGILLYRKYFHVGSYNAASSPQQQQPHPFLNLQPVEGDRGSRYPTAIRATAEHTEPLSA